MPLPHHRADLGKEMAKVQRGGCFGERALINRDVRAFNVMALGGGKVRAARRAAGAGLVQLPWRRACMSSEQPSSRRLYVH